MSMSRSFFSGMLVAHRGEICRHSEGQRAEALGPAAAAADAAAQRSIHVGKSHRTQQPGTAVSRSEWLPTERTAACWQMNTLMRSTHFHPGSLFSPPHPPPRLQLYLQLLQQSASTGNALNNLHPVSGKAHAHAVHTSLTRAFSFCVLMGTRSSAVVSQLVRFFFYACIQLEILEVLSFLCEKAIAERHDDRQLQNATVCVCVCVIS